MRSGQMIIYWVCFCIYAELPPEHQNFRVYLLNKLRVIPVPIKRFRMHFIIILTFFITGMAVIGVHAGPASPEAALEKLKAGNASFLADKLPFPGIDRKRRVMTAKDGQRPGATVITCSDSRVPAEYIFSAGIGDIFVIRVAGNVIGSDEAGSIEYGVEHLGTPLLVVLGHSSCGAVTSAVAGAAVHGNIPSLIDRIKPAVKKAHSENRDASEGTVFDTAITYNVWQSVEDLMKQSPVVVHLIREKKLKVEGAIYDMETGKVTWLGEHPSSVFLVEKFSSPVFRYFLRYFESPWSLFIPGLLLLSLVIYILFYRSMFKDQTRNRKYRIMTRIRWGYFSIIISGAAGMAAVALHRGQSAPAEMVPALAVLVLIVIFSLVFSFLFTRSIKKSFKNVITALKEKVEEQH